MSITIIVASSSNGIIGDSKTNKMPWHCSEELKFFKAETMGSTLIMGRKTAESVGKLPGRDSIVLSRDKHYILPGFETMSMDNFLFEYEKDPDKKYMVCGGAEIYRLFLPHAHYSIISTFNFPAVGDIWLPVLNRRDGYKWEKMEEIVFDEFTAVKWRPWEYC
jgi:dihydrofolate reductase